MHHSFDGLSPAIRDKKIEQMLLQHHVDIMRLFKRSDQRPQEWFGKPPSPEDVGFVEGNLPGSGGTTIVEGVLDADLDPSSDDGETETTADLSVYSGAGANWGDSGDDIEVTNRDDHFSAKSGERLVVYQTADGEYRPLVFPPMLRIGKTDSAHNKDASGTVSVYEGSAGAETDSGDNVSAYNHFADLESSKWTVTARINGEEYEIAGEC